MTATWLQLQLRGEGPDGSGITAEMVAAAQTGYVATHSEDRRNAAELCRDPNQQALIALSLASPMRGACYMTVLPLHLADTLNAGPADIGMVSPALLWLR